MNHERFQELLALRLYGEVDAAERAELDAHLATCAACARAARELDAGLGTFVPLARSGAPGDLAPRLARALAREESAARWSRWIPAAASFAAGALATWLVVRGGGAPDAPHASGLPPTTWERFHADTPPPAAASSGSLARWTDYARR